MKRRAVPKVEMPPEEPGLQSLRECCEQHILELYEAGRAFRLRDDPKMTIQQLRKRSQVCKALARPGGAALEDVFRRSCGVASEGAQAKSAGRLEIRARVGPTTLGIRREVVLPTLCLGGSPVLAVFSFRVCDSTHDRDSLRTGFLARNSAGSTIARRNPRSGVLPALFLAGKVVAPILR